MDLPGCPRSCPRPPGQHELNPRSRPTLSTLRLSPPRFLTSILRRRAYLKHGGQPWFRDYFSRLTPQNVHIAERQSSEASCRALVLRRFYQTRTPVVVPRRVHRLHLLWAQEKLPQWITATKARSYSPPPGLKVIWWAE